MGILKMTGKVDVGQFWPDGASDADTVNLEVKVASGGFEFQSDPSKPFKAISILDTALVKGSAAKATPVVDAKGIVRIRLQGIDAPELHYQLDARQLPKDTTDAQRQDLKTKKCYRKFRQPVGETAAAALGSKLSALGGMVDIEVLTEVDYPNEVFDTYGRFIGDIYVLTPAKLNLNMWLVQNGWAYPTFYASMTRDEIEAYMAAAVAASKLTPKPPVWKQYSKKIGPLDETLLYQQPTATSKPQPANNSGPVVLPKLFRRLVSYAMCKKVGITRKSLAAFLAEKPDECYLTSEFLSQGSHAAQTRYLHEFVDAKGTFKLLPQDLVFREKPSKLVDASGAEIKNWGL